MITQIEIEELEQAKLIGKRYGNIDDMFNHLSIKLGFVANLSLDDEDLSNGLFLYVEDLKVLLKAIELKVN